MPIEVLQRAATARNGVGAFVLQCRKIELGFCDWAGSSRGMNQFLQTRLASFAERHPAIDLHISPRPHRHPILRGVYVNGREKTICVRNMSPVEIEQKLRLLTESSGAKLKKVRHAVQSDNQSVRGVWSPFAANSPTHTI